MTTPTDAELQEAYDSVPAHGDQQVVHIAGLRAVLAKWGQPQAVAGGEPVAWLSVDCIGERYLCFTRPDDDDPVRPLVFGDTAPSVLEDAARWQYVGQSDDFAVCRFDDGSWREVFAPDDVIDAARKQGGAT